MAELLHDSFEASQESWHGDGGSMGGWGTTAAVEKFSKSSIDLQPLLWGILPLKLESVAYIAKTYLKATKKKAVCRREGATNSYSLQGARLTLGASTTSSLDSEMESSPSLRTPLLSSNPHDLEEATEPTLSSLLQRSHKAEIPP